MANACKHVAEHSQAVPMTAPSCVTQTLIAVFVSSDVKSSAAILNVLVIARSHAHHVQRKSALLLALTVSVVCPVEHLVTGFLVLAVARRFWPARTAALPSVVLRALMSSFVRNVPMRRSRVVLSI